MCCTAIQCTEHTGTTASLAKKAQVTDNMKAPFHLVHDSEHAGHQGPGAASPE